MPTNVFNEWWNAIVLLRSSSTLIKKQQKQNNKINKFEREGKNLSHTLSLSRTHYEWCGFSRSCFIRFSLTTLHMLHITRAFVERMGPQTQAVFEMLLSAHNTHIYVWCAPFFWYCFCCCCCCFYCIFCRSHSFARAVVVLCYLASNITRHIAGAVLVLWVSYVLPSLSLSFICVCVCALSLRHSKSIRQNWYDVHC